MRLASRPCANQLQAGKPLLPGPISAARLRTLVTASRRNRPPATVQRGAPTASPGPLPPLVGVQSQPRPRAASALSLTPATVPISETASQLLARRLPAHILPNLHGIRATGARARFIPTAPRPPASPAQRLAPVARRGRTPGPPLGHFTQAIAGSPQLQPARAVEAAKGLAFPHGPSKG